MKIVRESTIREYAQAYYARERWKNDNGKRDWEAICSGADPVHLLSRSKDEGGHPYKMPRPNNIVMKIAHLDEPDVRALVIHDYMVDDEAQGGRWIRERVIVPQPKTRVLDGLATIFLNTGYFEDTRWKDDQQQLHYKKWKMKNENEALQGILTGADRPLVESIGGNTFEIVDGWGRLLPLVALLQQGFRFYPVECFVAAEK